MADSQQAGEELGFLGHLYELRDRLLRVVIAVGIVFIVLFPFAKDLYNIFAHPLVSQVPQGMIVTGTAAPFLVPLKLALMTAFLIALPYVLNQFWGFVAPGLYQHEKRLALPLLISSVLLFYVGVLFAYLVLLPLMFSVLPTFVPDVATYQPDIGNYLDFVMALFLAFGIGFEMPIATILLIATGMSTREDLAKKRPYIIVGAFILGMLLTPPDVISQILLAVPMWLLFEVGLLASMVFDKQIKVASQERKAHDQAEREESMRAAGAGATTASTAAASAAYSPESPESDVAVGTADSSKVLWEDEKYVYADDIDPTGLQYEDSDEYRPLSDEELEAELARIEAEEEAEAAKAAGTVEVADNHDGQSKDDVISESDAGVDSSERDK